MATQTYRAQINLLVPGRDDLAVVYLDITDKPGLTAKQVARKATPIAQADVPNGKVVGYRIDTDGRVS